MGFEAFMAWKVVSLTFGQRSKKRPTLLWKQRRIKQATEQLSWLFNKNTYFMKVQPAFVEHWNQTKLNWCCLGKLLKLFLDQRSAPLRPYRSIPHPLHHKNTHYGADTWLEQKLSLNAPPQLPFLFWLWLSSSPSVMVIYISENNEAKAVKPREGWRGPQMSVS